ncbi:hypothetical protein KPH14_005690 [Odynerus spinipes]|uniref:Uncharacterized protein n=1 Tax=Odynerus spinipes TaxID=1348599 RepID=A0AAD9RAS8_9HYME|nr:hypothetical protein KPH14_005690 [Odynerus spinipes]
MKSGYPKTSNIVLDIVDRGCTEAARTLDEIGRAVGFNEYRVLVADLLAPYNDRLENGSYKETRDMTS